MGRNSRSDSDRGRSLFSRGLYRYYYYSVVNQREREKERVSFVAAVENLARALRNWS